MSEKYINVEAVDSTTAKVTFQKYFWFVKIGQPYTRVAEYHDFTWRWVKNGKRVHDLWLIYELDDAVDEWKYLQSKRNPE